MTAAVIIAAVSASLGLFVLPWWALFKGLMSLGQAVMMTLVAFVLIGFGVGSADATILFTAFAGTSAVLWFLLARGRRRWRAVAAELGLEELNVLSGWGFSGRLDDVDVRFAYSKTGNFNGWGWGTVAEAQFPTDHVGGLRVQRRRLGRKAGVDVGDGALSKAADISGDRDVAVVVLDAALRDWLAQVVHHDVVVDDHEVGWSRPRLVTEPTKLAAVAREMVRVVKQLTLTEDAWASRVAQRLETEAELSVRKRLVDVLERRKDVDSTMWPVLVATMGHSDSRTGVYAARAAGDIAALERFADHDDPETLRVARETLVKLGLRKDAGSGAMSVISMEAAEGQLSVAESPGELSLETVE